MSGEFSQPQSILSPSSSVILQSTRTERRVHQAVGQQRAHAIGSVLLERTLLVPSRPQSSFYPLRFFLFVVPAKSRPSLRVPTTFAGCHVASLYQISASITRSLTTPCSPAPQALRHRTRGSKALFGLRIPRRRSQTLHGEPQQGRPPHHLGHCQGESSPPRSFPSCLDRPCAAVNPSYTLLLHIYACMTRARVRCRVATRPAHRGCIYHARHVIASPSPVAIALVRGCTRPRILMQRSAFGGGPTTGLSRVLGAVMSVGGDTLWLRG